MFAGSKYKVSVCVDFCILIGNQTYKMEIINVVIVIKKDIND